jgi:5,10-methylenetetrahydrofolate reductase
MDVISRMKHGFDMGGNKLNRAPKDILIGSAANPFPLDLSVEMSKIKAKIRAGAEFFQTQPVYDIPKFKNFLKLVKPLGIRVIAGYIPIVDRRTLEIMEDIPGVVMPRAMVERLENSADIYGEGIALARDTILELHDMVDGIHMMNIGRVTPSLKVLELVKEQVKIAI